MNDDREWFAPKRYGYGATPITWQGWALTIGLVVIEVVLAAELARRPMELIAISVPIVLTFIVITAKTTRGGWRWRWGEED